MELSSIPTQSSMSGAGVLCWRLGRRGVVSLTVHVLLRKIDCGYVCVWVCAHMRTLSLGMGREVSNRDSSPLMDDAKESLELNNRIQKSREAACLHT